MHRNKRIPHPVIYRSPDYHSASLTVYICSVTNSDMMSNQTKNEGRSAKRFRETQGNIQDALAGESGDPSYSSRKDRQQVSILRQKETVDDNVLQQILALLKVPVSPFQSFDQEKTVNIIGNTFTDFKDGASAINIRPVFNNPLEAIVKLHQEQTALYERMLKEKDEVIAGLERLVEQK